MGVGVAGASTSSGICCRTTRTATTRVILKLRQKVVRRSLKELLTLPHPDTGIVTGAFSFNGRYVSRHLLDQGRQRKGSDHQMAGRGTRLKNCPQVYMTLVA